MIFAQTIDDIPGLVAMLRGLNLCHVSHGPHPVHNYATEAELADFLATAMADGAQVLAYRAGGVPRGYLMWRLCDVAPGVVDRQRRFGFLDHIYVEPSWRRKGIAGRLIARFESEIAAQACTGWRSTARNFNTASAALMARAGAEVAAYMFEKELVVRPAAGRGDC